MDGRVVELRTLSTSCPAVNDGGVEALVAVVVRVDSGLSRDGVIDLSWCECLTVRQTLGRYPATTNTS